MHRQRLSLAPTGEEVAAEGDGEKKDKEEPKPAPALEDTAVVADGAELVVKDLGPQIGWRTVFLVEYVRAVHHVIERADVVRIISWGH